jgi:hypothetical protein
MPALVIAELSWQPGGPHYSRAGVAPATIAGSLHNTNFYG